MSRLSRAAAHLKAKTLRSSGLRKRLIQLAVCASLVCLGTVLRGYTATNAPSGTPRLRSTPNSYAQTTIEPIFGPPSTRAPIQVLRSPKRAERLAVDATGNKARQPAYAPRNLPQGSREARLPADFDWRVYLQYHPELLTAGVSTRRQAERHYRLHGRTEGRLWRRQRVIIRYIAGTGLINQHYCHINAFALAAAIGAEVVLPPAAKRDSFGLYFSTIPKENQVSWAPGAIERILDVPRIISTWGAKGVKVHKTPPLTPFPNLVSPDTAFPLYDPPGIGRHLVTRIMGTYLANLDLDELVEVVRKVVVERARHLLQDNPDMDIPVIVVDLPVALFMFRTLSAPALVAEVAADLPFASTAQAVANEILQNMTKNGAVAFNSLHLRVEADAKDWMDNMGGSKVLENEYLRAMRSSNFSASVPVYVASGLLTYGAHDALQNINALLQEAGLCSLVYHKEQFISMDVMGGMESEETALVDLLVLAEGERFVGFGSSTFSFYLQHYRRFLNKAMSTTLLVNISDQIDQQLYDGGRIFADDG